jgi:serine/threonine-protein kinase
MTCNPPFTGTSVAEVLWAHEKSPPPPLPVGDDDESQILNEIFQLMMQKEPEERYQGMRELISDLELIYNGPADWGTGTGRTGRKSNEVSRPTAFGGDSLTSQGERHATSTVDEHELSDDVPP